MRHKATINVKGTYSGEEMGEEEGEEEEEERWGTKKKKERKKETRSIISQTVQGTKETRHDKSK